ncbi:hypothetical protein AMTRI_Chr11g158590 [Amborella trichopoda]
MGNSGKGLVGWFLLGFFLMIFGGNYEVNGAKLATAMFNFGDSLTDCGNNNNLASLAKSNYVPYGIDFFMGPTGRFCNGRTIADFLGELLGLPYIPPFEDPNTKDRNLLSGVNYASAAAGILDETGYQLGDRISLSQQVLNFESTLNELRGVLGGVNPRLMEFLSKSIAFVVFGSNDYINNYLLPSLYTTSYNYSPEAYSNLLLTHYTRQILALHSLGLRKFVLAGVGPLGCIPNQLATGLAPNGSCVTYVNEIVGSFNIGLRDLVTQLNANHPNATFIYGNVYGALGDILHNPSTYGFKVANRGCCGLGRNEGQITCLPLATPCPNRNEYVFWDAFHPTEAVNNILAHRAFTGPPSVCYPINVQELAMR